MRIEITSLQARVLGSLIEKEVTTPDQYPLTLSSLTHACNQKSSRDPVMQLSEAEVQEIVDGLVRQHLISDRSGFGGRVTRYQHRFCNAGFGSLEFSAQELGILCVLLLRGPQTPGELRTRTNRLCSFSDVHEAETVLHSLMERDDGPFVARLQREPGKRESRYVQLFSDVAEPAVVQQEQDMPDTASAAGPDSEREIEQLEASMLQLQERLSVLEARVEQLEGRHEE